MPLDPATLPFAIRLKVGSDAAIAVRPSDGKLVGCDEGGDEFELGSGGGGGEVTAGDGLTGGGALPATLAVGATDSSIDVAANGISVSEDIQDGAAAGATALQPGFALTDGEHGSRAGGSLHSNATTGTAGFMSAADKTKLNSLGYSTGALFFSIVDWFTTGTALAPNAAAGNFTTGCRFSVTQSMNILGVRFYWPGVAARTIKCALRNSAGTVMDSVDVSVNGAGYYTGTFATPQAVTSTADGALYRVTIWEKSATEYAKHNVKPTTIPALPFAGGPKVVWSSFSAWAAGDANPTSTSATEHYSVEPIFE